MNEFRIIVIDGGQGLGDGVTPKPKTPAMKEKDEGNWRNSRLAKALRPMNTVKKKLRKGGSPMTAFAIDAGLGLAQQMVRSYINFRISDIGRRHGDSNYQARVQRQIERITDPMNIGRAAITGAAAGAMFGPKGMIIGAVVGAASSAIGIGFRQAGRQRAYAHQMFEANNSQAYGLARANFSAHTGRLR